MLAGEIAREIGAQGKDHGGIGLQRDALLQAAHEYPRDLRPLVRDRGFLFDQGGQDEQIVSGAERQVRRTGGPCAREFLSHALMGLSQQDQIGRAAGEQIGVRKELPLGREVRRTEGRH